MQKLKLKHSFYQREDVVRISQELLGKVLCSQMNDRVTRAMITETEAYAGIVDKASHAYGGRRTKRTEPLYAAGGTAYVYLCYGIHHLFNVVTGGEGTPHAVLIRAGQPVSGIEWMKKRRSKTSVDGTFMGGPGTLAQAMGITTALTGCDLTGNQIWIEDHGVRMEDYTVTIGPRVGVDYAGEDAARPYRFIMKSA